MSFPSTRWPAAGLLAAASLLTLTLPLDAMTSGGLVLAGLVAGWLLGRGGLGRAQLQAAIRHMPMPLALLGPGAGSLVGNPAFGRLPPTVARAMREAPLGQVVAVGAADGRWWAVWRAPLPGRRSIALGCDISLLRQRDAAQDTLTRAEHAALTLSPIGLWLLDAKGRTVFGNPALAALFGGAVPEDVASSGLPLDRGFDRGLPLGLPAGQTLEVSLPGAHGQRRPVALTATPWRMPSGDTGCCLSVADNAPLRAAQARVEHLAEHDPLTGLANRAQFRAALVALSHSPEGGALVLLDLDRFGSVNDRHGMATGDAVLRSLARRLRVAVRPADLVCRLGDVRFAALVFGGGEEARASVVERLRAAIGEPIRVDGMTLQLTASLGSALARQDAGEPEGLLRAADLAQRQARLAGGDGHAAFRPELLAERQRRDRLREALGEALAGDAPQPGLHLHYQPQRHWQDGALAGAEALLRWHCAPLNAAISPAELLPIATEAGLLAQLDAFVLESALARIAGWQDQPGAPPLVSVNITATGLRNPGFADQVARALLRHGVPAGKLEIEIPEDLAVRDLPAIQLTLQALHELGVRLALDDFGSGHSSLPHIVRLPVQRLKLDRSIVSGLPGDAKASAVLQATMAIARDLGIEVVGEGVETEAQAMALAAAGCTLLQGWLTGRPGPAELLGGQAARTAA